MEAHERRDVGEDATMGRIYLPLDWLEDEGVDPDGAYYPDVPLFGGLKVLETEGKKSGKFGPANETVIKALIQAGTLLARGRLEHSYPHSWRSKAPVIFRNTPQWFIRLDEPLNTPEHGGRTLRQTALAAIDATHFQPEAGRKHPKAFSRRGSSSCRHCDSPSCRAVGDRSSCQENRHGRRRR